MCSRGGRRRRIESCNSRSRKHRVGMMALLAEEKIKVWESGSVSVGVGRGDLDLLDLKNVLVDVFVPR